MTMPSSCLPPLLCVLLPLHFARIEPHLYFPNISLVFDSSTHSDSLRTCSCAMAVRHCEVTLANLLCNCATVHRSLLRDGGPWWDNRRTNGTLTVWLHNSWVLRELLNGSHIPDLQLSLCTPGVLHGQAQYLTLVGLRRLRVYTSVKDQTMNIAYGAGLNVRDGDLSIALLEVGSLSGALRLKAYSVVGPSLQVLKQSFPNLTLSEGGVLSSDLECMYKSLMITFIY